MDSSFPLPRVQSYAQSVGQGAPCRGEPHGHEHGFGLEDVGRQLGGAHSPFPAALKSPLLRRPKAGLGGPGPLFPARAVLGGSGGSGTPSGPPCRPPLLLSSSLNTESMFRVTAWKERDKWVGASPKGREWGASPHTYLIHLHVLLRCPLFLSTIQATSAGGSNPQSPPLHPGGEERGCWQTEGRDLGGPHSGQPPLGWGWLPRDPSPRRGGVSPVESPGDGGGVKGEGQTPRVDEGGGHFADGAGTRSLAPPAALRVHPQPAREMGVTRRPLGGRAGGWLTGGRASGDPSVSGQGAGYLGTPQGRGWWLVNWGQGRGQVSGGGGAGQGAAYLGSPPGWGRVSRDPPLHLLVNSDVGSGGGDAVSPSDPEVRRLWLFSVLGTEQILLGGVVLPQPPPSLDPNPHLFPLPQPPRTPHLGVRLMYLWGTRPRAPPSSPRHQSGEALASSRIRSPGWNESSWDERPS